MNSAIDSIAQQLATTNNVAVEFTAVSPKGEKTVLIVVSLIDLRIYLKEDKKAILFAILSILDNVGDMMVGDDILALQFIEQTANPVPTMPASPTLN